jgi:hypothetical protein
MLDPGAEHGVTRLRVSMSRPKNWNVEATRRTDVGMLCKGVFAASAGRARSISTLYGTTNDAIQSAVSIMSDSPAVYAVSDVNLRAPAQRAYTPHRASQTFLIEYDESNHMSDALIERGFVLGESIRTQNGIEDWVLLARGSHPEIIDRIEQVSSEEDVEINVRGITSPEGGVSGPLPVDSLSPRQREVFQLARAQGYYASPAKSSAAELADQLDLSASTFHEHLHKAEEKLLDLSNSPRTRASE